MSGLGADGNPGVRDLGRVAERLARVAMGRHECGALERVRRNHGPGALHVADRSTLDGLEARLVAEGPDGVNTAVVGEADGHLVGRRGREDVEHAGWNVRVLDDLAERHAREPELADDEHDCIAHGERGSDGVDDAEQRECIRSADADHTDRLVGSGDLDLGVGHGLHHATVGDSPGSPREESLHSEAHLENRLLPVAAGLPHDLGRESLTVAMQLLGHEHEHLAARVATRVRPARLSAAGGSDGVSNVLATRLAEVSDVVAGGREQREAATAIRANELAVHEETMRLVEASVVDVVRQGCGRLAGIDGRNAGLQLDLGSLRVAVSSFGRRRRLELAVATMRVIDRDVVHTLVAALATVAALTHATEAGGSVEEFDAVDPAGAGVDAARDVVSLADVVAPHRAGQAVLGTIRELDGLVRRAKLHDREHGSEDFVARDRVARTDVGEKRGTNVEAGRRECTLGLPDHCAVFARESDHPGDLVELSLRVLRAHVRVLVERIADADAREAALEHLDQPVVDAFVDDEARQSAADLSFVEEDAAHHGLGHRVEIRVVTDDHSRLAAELHGELLLATRRRLTDGAAGGRGAREGVLPGGVVCDDVLARLAVAGHHIEDSRGEPDVLTGFGEEQARDGRGIAGLDDQRVAGPEDGSSLPAEEHGREVPGLDRSDDSTGLALREEMVEVGGERRMMSEVPREDGDVAEPRLAERLAGVERLEHFEVAAVPEHVALEGVEVATTVVAGQTSPAGEGGRSGGVGRSHVSFRTLRELAEHLPVVRVGGIEEFRTRVRELSADEVAEAAVAALQPRERPRRTLRRSAVVETRDKRGKISCRLHGVLLAERHAVGISVLVAAPVRVGGELKREVVVERRGAKTEQRGADPAPVETTELLEHEDEPLAGVSRGADATGRLEADHATRIELEEETADHAHHDETDRERGVDRLHARGCLDEVCAGHDGHGRCHGDDPVVLQIAGAEDHLEVSLSACFAHGDELVVELAPAVAESQFTADHDIDLGSSTRDCFADLRAAHLETRVLSVREVGGNRGDGHATLQPFDRPEHLLAVHADCAGSEPEVRISQLGKHRT